MLLASLLITLSQIGSPNISKEEVERKARELGMVYREEVVTFTEPGQSLEKHLEEQEKLSASDVEANQEIKVVVPSGSTSEEIALILKNNGIIQSEEEFLKVIKARYLSSKLKAGEFLFPKGVTIDEVITFLTD